MRKSGVYYRTDDVYIMKGTKMDALIIDLGERDEKPYTDSMDYERLDEFMDMLFSFINNDKPTSSMEVFTHICKH